MLYFGPLAVVERVGIKSEVESAMVIFGKKLKEIEAAGPRELPADELENYALAIARASRDLLTSKWNVGGISEWARRQ